MNLESLANLGEFVGAIAVVVSLVYLAVQLRQSNRAQSTENYARVLERFAQLQSNLAHNPAVSVIHAKGVEDMASLTPKERVQVVWSLHELFDCIEFLYQSAESGTVPDEIWERWSMAAAWWLSYPGVREWWNAKAVPYTKNFTEFVDQTIADNPTPDGTLERWRLFVETGRAG